jgi:hypothetical protein
MEIQKEIEAAEAEIDSAFASNELAALPFAQSVWTLLSVAEDMHFKNMAHSPLSAQEGPIFIDGLLNSLTYPLRICYERAERRLASFQRLLVNEHYSWAVAWLHAAEDYAQFCSIFPLYHAGQLSLNIDGFEIIPGDQQRKDLRYEVYDRFVARRDPEKEMDLDATPIMGELRASLNISGSIFSVDFSRRLMDCLYGAYGEALEGRHSLPDSWKFSRFTLLQFRAVFTCLQLMAHAWFVARYLVVSQGTPAMAFPSAVWTPKSSLLVCLIARHTKLTKAIVAQILGYLTFGGAGVRNPDIAIQPIIDLKNGQLAISPFVLTHVNAERNLCVLLNQIPVEKKLYSALVHQKEEEIRTETICSLRGLDLDFKFGQITGTDIDLAIIDRVRKKCLCVEIKWFIEPAEIREVLARSEEIARGVAQALKINTAFAASDQRLLNLLEIDASYEFLAMVGSVNFIGRHGQQHTDVPVTKIWHLVAEIRRSGGLTEVFEWLRNRQYLPEETEFRILEIPIECGPWRSSWYGIAYALTDGQ